MAKVVIRPFHPQHLAQLPNIITGYVTQESYTVEKHEQGDNITFSLTLVRLPVPQTIIYHNLDETELARLAEVATEGLSFGAFIDDQLVAVSLASTEIWNRSLRIWEFHVGQVWRGQGIGQRLMERMVETAVSHHLRVIVCETQSRNVPAIRFYRKMGFALDSIDLSFYSNEDVQKGDVAIFMKRYLPE